MDKRQLPWRCAHFYTYMVRRRGRKEGAELKEVVRTADLCIVHGDPWGPAGGKHVDVSVGKEMKKQTNIEHICKA
jgi:hypothetical protein